MRKTIWKCEAKEEDCTEMDLMIPINFKCMAWTELSCMKSEGTPLFVMSCLEINSAKKLRNESTFGMNINFIKLSRSGEIRKANQGAQ